MAENFEGGEVIVALNSTVEQFENSSIFAGIDPESVEVIYVNNDAQVPAMVLLHLRDSDPQAVNDAIAALHQCDYCILAEPNYIAEFHLTPNDPLFRSLYGMQVINAPEGWNMVTGNPNTLVGVLDSGVDATHPDLRQNLRIPADPRFSDFNDFTGHGTHVAGTIGAIGNNGIGVVGTCWRVGMFIFKVGNNNISMASAITAINYARLNNIPIINCSWGSRQYSATLLIALQQYRGLIIASAGNDGTNNDTFPMYPASHRLPNMIAVAATGPGNTIAPFSNFGVRSVQIAAPGEDVLSTDIGNRYTRLSGTSMAAPHVAGAAALLMSLRPNLTTTQVRNLILSTATRLPSTAGRVSTGILNIAEMVRAAVGLV